ncbi:hypothetical protein ACQ4PT_017281 [Festuca glaucescens]
MVVGFLSTASTRVLVNGAAGDLIYNRRGLRQGDPLSSLLFDSVMEVLHLLLRKVASEGLLSRLAPRGLLHRTSMYANDVVTFIKPERADLLACAAVVEDFGEASGLRTKCSLHPIRCTVDQVELAQSIPQCSVEGWPCKYLGLPLGLRKVSAAQLQPVVESAASWLPLWSARLLNHGGQTILVQTTLSAILIHAMMSLDIPPKTMQALKKICQGFMWKARADVSGGHCLVAWDKVTSPKSCGGLGLPNLQLLNLAMRCRWAWLQRVDATKAWAEFDLQIPPLARALFESATAVVVGNGERALF